MLFCLNNSALPAFEIAITIDDLPVSGELPVGQSRLEIANTILATLKKHHVEGVYGFVIGKEVTNNPDGSKILQTWIKDGNQLGNHTYSHLDLSQVTSTQYVDDIKRNDMILTSYSTNQNHKYFRYPFLSEGNTAEKRETVRRFLLNNNYQIAPVTLDFSDYEWNQVYAKCLFKKNENGINWLRKSYIEHALAALENSRRMSKHLYGRDIKYILLLHLGAFDAVMMDELLTSYEKHGAKFISLSRALSDPFYKISPDIVSSIGCNYLIQFSLGTCWKSLQHLNLLEKSHC